MSTVHKQSAKQVTGPSMEGKLASARHAIVTAPTGRTVLLASDEVAEYTDHLCRHYAEYLPVTDAQSNLVQTIADCAWRMRRIVVLESGIYASGEQRSAQSVSGERVEVRRALSDVETYLTYERQLTRLAIQEDRLERQKAKAVAALLALKKNRPQRSAGISVDLSSNTFAAESCDGVGFALSLATSAHQAFGQASGSSAYNPV